jgi:transcriptional regulator with XRE-family HTH domain
LGAAYHSLGPEALNVPLTLEHLRRRRPWTQKELAEAAGVSVGTVRGIEHGYYKSVRPRVMRAVAGALGVQPSDVVEFRPSLGLPPEGGTQGGTQPDPVPSGYAAPEV